MKDAGKQSVKVTLLCRVTALQSRHVAPLAFCRFRLRLL